jgi:hypothetical protein
VSHGEPSPNQALERENARHREELASVLESSSWRPTRPLRRLRGSTRPETVEHASVPAEASTWVDPALPTTSVPLHFRPRETPGVDWRDSEQIALCVLVHVHDAFLPGDYPEAWVREGWRWNEAYLLHSLLTFNSDFEIEIGARYMVHLRPEALAEAFPGWRTASDRGGAALWFRRRPESV